MRLLVTVTWMFHCCPQRQQVCHQPRSSRTQKKCGEVRTNRSGGLHAFKVSPSLFSFLLRLLIEFTLPPFCRASMNRALWGNCFFFCETEESWTVFGPQTRLGFIKGDTWLENSDTALGRTHILQEQPLQSKLGSSVLGVLQRHRYFQAVIASALLSERTHRKSRNSGFSKSLDEF